MPQTLVQKILADHLVEGELEPGKEIGIRIDQTLTQDATGTTAFLLLEAMAIPRVKTEASVSYVDHNMSQFGPENHNDHLYLKSIATKLGAYHSRPGNGICHQVHLERFGRPGATLLGSDSHTPTNGGMGMVAIGAGGLDVAVAMGGGAFFTTCPRVIGVELKGKLQPWVAAKDIILRLLSILTTKGNVGCMVEYHGEGVASLPVPARATCTNMGAELGVTTSVFPSDAVTRQFLEAQNRGAQYAQFQPDPDASYDRITKRHHSERDAQTIENIRTYCTNVEVKDIGNGYVEISFDRIVIDLDQLEPLAAAPSSPDNIVSIAEMEGTKVDQVVIGSCTNSSFQDLMTCAKAIEGKTVHENIELGIAPGSRQVMTMIAKNGALAEFVRCGARIIESACGPCIGQGFSPAEGAISVRTFNRNFAGRTGTTGDKAYLVSPETAIAAAIAGEFIDPRKLTEKFGIEYPEIAAPEQFLIDDGMVLQPLPEDRAAGAEIVRGSTIVKPPAGEKLPDTLSGQVVIKVGDKITTDHIMPAGALLKHRSNVPVYAQYVFNCFNEEGEESFADRCLRMKEQGVGGIIVAGDSYGQGSSREHAALCPMYLGVKVVIAKAIERIHQANLVNFGILPLTFQDEADYEKIDANDQLVVESTGRAVASGETAVVKNITKNEEYTVDVNLSPRQREILSAGGLLHYTRQQAS